MLEDITFEEEVVRRPVARNAIAYYFGKAKDLQLGEEYVYFLSEEAKKSYSTVLQEAYDILFDRVMTSRMSSFLKEEVEQWYSFNRDFLGFCDTVDMNRELEEMLTRFKLL